MDSISEYLAQKAKEFECPLITKSELLGLDQKILLGKGGFGKVYKCSYKSIEVVLKKLRFLRTSEMSELNFILNEVKNLFLMNSLNINIPVLRGIYIGKNNIGIVMDYVSGYTLSKYKELDNFTKLRICRDIALILHEVHKKRLIHRDIKPENIIYNLSGNELKVYLIDFGLSRIAMRSKTRTESARATPQYSGPEATDVDLSATDDDKPLVISVKLDIWSYGCVVSEIFSGYIPWQQYATNVTYIETMLIQRKPFPIPDNLDGRIKEIVEKCVEYDPDNRPTALEIVKMFENILNSF